MGYFSVQDQSQYAYIKAFFEVIIYFGLTLVNFFLLSALICVARRRFKSPPKMRNDEFIAEHGYSYDYVFVFKVYMEDELADLNSFQKKYTMKNIIDRCQNSKIETKCFYSCQRDEIYVKMRCEPERLLAEADRIDYKLLLDEVILQQTAQRGSVQRHPNGKHIWEPIELSDDSGVSSYKPYEFIFAKYDSAEELQPLYKRYPATLNPDTTQILKQVDRIKLMLSIFEAGVSENPPGCGMLMRRYVKRKAVLAHFPLHEFESLYSIERRWLVVCASAASLPIEDIKNYFGERIALYFVFLRYMTLKLRLPALLGIGVYAVQIYFQRSGYFLMPVLAIYTTLWSSYFIENWKQLQSTTAMQWGVTGFESEESDRPQFTGETTSSPVTGQPMLYFSARDRIAVQILSGLVIFFFILLSFGFVGLVAYIQFQLNENGVAEDFTYKGKNLTSYISALLLMFCISVLNQTFPRVAKALNNNENYRTDTDYEDNLVSKTFVFQLFNNYSYLTFLAFVKPFMTIKCIRDDCYVEIEDTLLVLYVVPVIINAITEVLFRKMAQSKKFKQETSGLEPGSVVGIVEEQYILNEYRVLPRSMKDYSELVLLYGYVTLFVAVFPIGAFLALTVNFVRIRVDGWKLCQIFRRPDPKTAEDIGVWQNVMELMGVLAVVYSMALICFTGNYMVDIAWDMRWVIFMVSEHAFIIYKVFLGVTIEDIPEEVQMQMDRQEFLVSRVIGNVMDEAEDTFDQVGEATNIAIAVTDNDWVYPDPEEPVPGEDEDGLELVPTEEPAEDSQK